MLLPIVLFLIFAIFCCLMYEPMIYEWVHTKANKHPIIPIIAGVLIVILVFVALLFDSYNYLNFRR